MQKKFQRMTALLLCLLMALPIAACTQDTSQPQTPDYHPQSALELWERISDTMDALDAMEMTIFTRKAYFEMGYQYEQEILTYVLATRDVHYTNSASRLFCQVLSLDQTVELMEAYYEGKMYRSISDGAYTQKFCSELSHEEYDGLQSGSLTNDLSIADCTTAEFSAEADGQWQLQFSGYTKKTIDQAMVTLGLEESAMSASVADMQVTLTANESFQVTQMEIDFVFAASGVPLPVFTVKTVYSDWNTAEFDTGLLNTEEYTQVEDVYLLDTVSAAIRQWQDATVGQFTVETKTTEEFQNQTRTSEEKGLMIYGWKNGAYCYFFEGNTEGQDFVVHYQNGEQTVTSDGESYTVSKSEDEAKAYIDGLIDIANYNPNAVTGIEKCEDGSYLLTIDRPDVTGYVPGVDVENAYQQISVTFTDGMLSQIKSQLIVEGAFEEDVLKLQSDSLVVFAPNAEFPET